MITMNEFVDLRMQQHIAHEIYRHQIMQRIPDPFPPILPIAIPRHIVLPSRANLPGVEIALQNDELWKQFHQIGTEMIITKSGRRMFPSMRLSISGLENESNYCILLEMVPTGDCRYKFSGSQWVPAGGAEPQSPQRMYLHTDSPASGAHWQAQPILFNKVKLTNNTLDNNGHIVLASMHKYQPRIHIIRTPDPTQIPWSPQQSFVFPETEFVAVTAYQNDSITKLKIDNNPFAKGFRETGQSRCKRKTSSSPEIHLREMSPSKLASPPRASTCEKRRNEDGGDPLSGKRIRSNESACSISSLDEICFPTSISSNSSSGKNSPTGEHIIESRSYATHTPVKSEDKIMQNKQPFINPSFFNLASSYLCGPQYPLHTFPFNTSQANELPTCLEHTDISVLKPFKTNVNLKLKTTIAGDKNQDPANVVKIRRRNNFSISAILGSNS